MKYLNLFLAAFFFSTFGCVPERERPGNGPTVRIPGKGGLILSEAQFSPDGKTILALFHERCDGPKVASLREVTSIYDSRSGKRLASGPRIYNPPPWCPFVPNRTLLLIERDLDVPAPAPWKANEKDGDQGCPLSLWDWTSRKFIREFSPATDHIGSLAVSANGQLAVTGHSNGQILAWDLPTGKQVRCFETAPVKDLSDRHTAWLYFVSGGSRVIACSGDSIKVWDVLSGKEIGPTFTEYAAAQKVSYHYKSCFSPEAMLLCTYVTHSVAPNPSIRIWDVNTGKLKKEINVPVAATTPVKATAAFAEHGKRLLTWDNAGLRFWDVASGKKGEAVKVSGQCVSPDGRLVVTRPNDAEIGLWDIEKQELAWSARAESSGEEHRRAED